MKLVADIGGTNARFALVDGAGPLAQVRRYSCSAYPGLQAVIEDYLSAVGVPASATTEAAISVAMPVTGDLIQLTNNPWGFSCRELQSSMGWQRLKVINDFAAIALSLPYLTASDYQTIGDDTQTAPDLQAPMLVLGPGTGLGVAGLVPAGAQRWIPIATEGGHITLSAHDDRESEILRLARATGKHISAERLLSGMGLPLLHRLVCEVDGLPFQDYTASALGELATDHDDRTALNTLNTFFAMLGSVAGNLALSLGARGGVYLAGGVLPKMRVIFLLSAFRQRFVDKGRFVNYLAPIPTRLIVHDNPALLGLARGAGTQ